MTRTARCLVLSLHSARRSRSAMVALALGAEVILFGPRFTQGQQSVDPLSGRPMAKIVGIGAASCPEFVAQIRAEPQRERDYLAWAQGFMSGALMRSEEDASRGLDLSPVNFPLSRQAEFLRNFCLERAEASYAEGVIALYRKLRGAPI